MDEICSLLSEYGVTEKPRDIHLYRNAMVHKSYCTRKNENFVDGNTLCPKECLPLQEESNERLEFLGDSVLSIVVANYLFERYPDENEGFLTRMRTKIVNGKMLANLSKKVGLPKYILLSKQIEDNDGRCNLNILEDAFEAFLAAVYLDFGFNLVQEWIIQVLETHLDFAELVRHNNNHKDMLLKYFQQNFGYIPRFYEMDVETHNNVKTYKVCVKSKDDHIISIGHGCNKKEAENNAAQNAMEQFKS
jgi:ribonuclease III